MFVINNEILTKQNLPEHWAWYQKKLEKLKAQKRFYTFSAFRFHRYETDENGRKVRMKRFKQIPTTSTFENKEMHETQTWIYVPSANSIRNENGLVRILNPKPFMISESSVYDIEKDAEIVFYLSYVSEALSNKRIFLVDHDSDNIKKANETAIAAEAQYLIFSPQSPINEANTGSDQVYRQLGIAYGINATNDLHLAELKNKLWANLVSINSKSPNKKIYESFIKDCYNSTDAEYKSTVLLAVERGVLYFDKGGWWIKIRGEYDELIVRVASNESVKKKEILTGYLMQHREYMTIVREAIENSSKRLSPGESLKPREVKIPTVQIQEMSRKEMMRHLQDNGWNFRDLMKFKNPELIDMIKEDRKPSRVLT